MDLDRIKSIVVAINKKYDTLHSLSNDELRECYAKLHTEALDKVKKGVSDNEVMNSALVEVFALFKEVARRFAEYEKLKVCSIDLDVKLFNCCDFVEDCEINREDWTDYSHLYCLNYVSSWYVGKEKFKWNIIPYDEQLMGGVVLHEGKIIEMYTGEGKTFVSIAPVLLNALVGKNTHIMTSNAYLSQRDYEITRPIYSFFGLTVGCIEGTDKCSSVRKNAYGADVVFGTTSSFIFDYLFDMSGDVLEKRVQNKYDFVILDEADSVLIDNAATPHIISSLKDEPIGEGKIYNRYLPIVQELVALNDNDDFFIKNKIKHYASFTKEGKKWLKSKLQDELLYNDSNIFENRKTEILSDETLTIEQKKARIDTLKNQYLYSKTLENVLNKLLLALTVYEENVDYVVTEYRYNFGAAEPKEKKVVIIDPNTGRLKEKSRWEYGLHEAIEAKEGIEAKVEDKESAIISVKNYLKKYDKIAGMTGTAMACSDELDSVYGLSVQNIPTHRPVIRKDLSLRVFRTQKSLDEAVIDEAVKLQKKDRPVLVCTPTIKRCEMLVSNFKKRKIGVQVLNGKTQSLSVESSIIANAGKHGCITIATSVAGRGTDIKIDDEAIENGGLAVIGVEMANSIRIDQQLAGRSGRQGNPGSSQFFVSLEDDILEYLSGQEKSKLLKVMNDDDASNSELSSSLEVHELFGTAQRRCMEVNRRRREASNLRDDTIDIFRARMYSLKNRILRKPEESEDVFKELCLEDKSFLTDSKACLEHLKKVVLPILKNVIMNTYVTESYQRLPLSDGTKVFSIPFDLDSALATSGKSLCSEIEKSLLVSGINNLWMNYINEINKESLQTEDLVEIFDVSRKQMLNELKNKLARLFIPVNEIKNVEKNKKNDVNAPILKYTNIGQKVIAMTDLCPCGSGKRYWQCHGVQKLLNLKR